MTLQIQLDDKATNRLIALYFRKNNLEGKYTDTLKADIEEHASRLLHEAIRARYNAEKWEEPELTPEQLAEDEATAIEYGFLVVEERGE